MNTFAPIRLAFFPLKSTITAHRSKENASESVAVYKCKDYERCIFDNGKLLQ